MVYAGIDKIQCPDGRAITFERAHDKALNQVAKWTDTKQLPIALSWDAKTGMILSDNRYTYQIAKASDDKTPNDKMPPQMFRKNIVTGEMESFYFDEKHGTIDRTLPGGTIRHIEMIQAPGPNYKKIRLIEETKNGKTSTVLRRAFDDEGNMLQEAIGLPNGAEQIKQFVYDDAGRVVTYLLNGKEMWNNVYDPATGLLTERDLPSLGVKIGFDRLSTGDVKETIEKTGGAVTATKTLAPPEWQSTIAAMQRIE